MQCGGRSAGHRDGKQRRIPAVSSLRCDPGQLSDPPLALRLRNQNPNSPSVMGMNAGKMVQIGWPGKPSISWQESKERQ